MKARVLFGVGGFVFVLLALFVFPPVVLGSLMLPLCALATYELLGSTKLVRANGLLYLSMLTSACVAAVCAFGLSVLYLQGILVLFAVIGFLLLLRSHTKIDFNQIACAAFGALMLPYMLLALIRIFNFENGKFLVLMPLLAAWGSDTFAYFAGRLFGRHKLAPVISPKKTIEGAVGGVFGGIVCIVAFVAILDNTLGSALPYSAAVVLGALGAIIGQIGDLSFSIIKRQTGIKDYGRIFPGHGGVLDRFDSVIFVAPVVEVMLLAFLAA